MTGHVQKISHKLAVDDGKRRTNGTAGFSYRFKAASIFLKQDPAQKGGARWKKPNEERKNV